jgi:hypothetical protein
MNLYILNVSKILDFYMRGMTPYFLRNCEAMAEIASVKQSQFLA